jgi:hypothetical protein
MISMIVGNIAHAWTLAHRLASHAEDRVDSRGDGVHQRVGAAASVLAAPLIDGPQRRLVVAHASRYAWQLADEDGRVATSVIFPGAVRLPSAIAVPAMPATPSSVSVGDGAVTIGRQTLKVARWWRPARPRTPLLRGRVAASAVRGLARRLPELVGLGGGLTPYGDDVVCGALVACRAAGSPETGLLAEALRGIDLERRTTATSALLLRLASEGWCIDEVAGYLGALARGGADLESARAALLRVGHSSGAGLLEGIHRAVPTAEPEWEREVA